MYYLNYCGVCVKKSDSLIELFNYLKNICADKKSINLVNYDLLCDVDKTYNVNLIIKNIDELKGVLKNA